MLQEYGKYVLLKVFSDQPAENAFTESSVSLNFIYNASVDKLTSVHNNHKIALT